MTCEEVRIALGAHALGALDPDEALEVDTHLATCETCGGELLELEGVAAFLGKVSERDVELVASPPRQVLDRLLNARAKRYRRGRLLMAVAASVAVIAVGGTVWTATQQESARQTSVAAPQKESKASENAPYMASDSAPETALRAQASESAVPRANKKTGDGQVFRGENTIRDYYATVSAVPGESGTQLLVSVRNIPVGTVCSLAVYDDAGEREVTGSWTVTRDTYRKESVFGMETAVAMRDIARFEVVDGAGRVLVNVEGPARK